MISASGGVAGAWAALVRPDVFRSVVFDERAVLRVRHRCRSAQPMRRQKPKREDPVPGELGSAAASAQVLSIVLFDAGRPNADLHRAPQGLHDFLRGYYHHKGARTGRKNAPHPLKSWSAGELAKMPTYYVMDFSETMAETVAKGNARQRLAIGANRWLPDNELAFYSAEYTRTGFPGRPCQWLSLPHLRRIHGRTRNIFRPQHRSAFLLHRRASQDWGHLSATGRVSKGCRKKPPARAWSALI